MAAAQQVSGRQGDGEARRTSAFLRVWRRATLAYRGTFLHRTWVAPGAGLRPHRDQSGDRREFTDRQSPDSVGTPLADVEIRIGEDSELLVRSPGIMLGYWGDPAATSAMIDADGWLHTGDQVRIDAQGHILITGRLKDILVLANGEKVSPADMEMAIQNDPWFEQVMVIGDDRPYLCALVVFNADQWRIEASKLGLDASDPGSLDDERVCTAVLQRIAARIESFPGYAQIRRVACYLEPWTIDAGTITPTLKLRRTRILEHYQAAAERLYSGH